MGIINLGPCECCGGGGGGVTVPCCGNELPDTLTLTIVGKGSYPMNWTGGGWETGPFSLPGCTGTLNIGLACEGAAVDAINFGNSLTGGAPDCVFAWSIFSYSRQCDPFVIEAQGTGSGVGCTCTGPFTFIATE